MPGEFARNLHSRRPAGDAAKLLADKVLAIQTTQEVNNLRRNRLFQKIAIHLPKVIADAYSNGTGNPGISIISAYCRFRKRI